MKQTIFTTRNRAEELQREVTAIWKSGDNYDKIEGIENDPVISILMMALAYQSNQMDETVENMRDQVLSDFAQMITPRALLAAKPAMAVVHTVPAAKVASVELGSSNIFTLTGSSINFIPLFKSTIIATEVKSVTRIDGRRWKVILNFNEPRKDLNGVSFQIKNTNFKDIKISCGEKTLKIVKPWDCSELPLQKCFGVDSMLYNQQPIFSGSTLWFELFAQQNLRIFYFGNSAIASGKSGGVEHVELTFEYLGIEEDFVFNSDTIEFNIVPIVNVDLHSHSLSPSNPIIKVGGDDDITTQFIFMIRQDDDIPKHDDKFIVRRLAMDRFDFNSLLRLTRTLIEKFSSEYYAYQSLSALANKSRINRLHMALKDVIEEIANNAEEPSSGVYIMLKNGFKPSDNMSEMVVRYVTTHGKQINSLLSRKSTFTTPVALNAAKTIQISDPIKGENEKIDTIDHTLLSRYFMQTNDRLVTMSDIKMFCYKEMFERYDIQTEMISDITVSRQPNIERNHVGYEIIISIEITDNIFVQRSIGDKIANVELLLQKMIEVRSSGILPIQVAITIAK